MNAYTLVGPTKRYPCDFNCLANASACGVDFGRSATDRGARSRVIRQDFARAVRLGDADIIARALSTVAWILPVADDRGVLDQPVHVPLGHRGDLGDVEAPECLPERVPLPEHDRPAQPDLEY